MKTATKEKPCCPECGSENVMIFLGNVIDKSIAKEDVFVCIAAGCSVKFFMKNGEAIRVDETICRPFTYHVKTV